jgi:hypothetical protein
MLKGVMGIFVDVNANLFLKSGGPLKALKGLDIW